MAAKSEAKTTCRWLTSISSFVADTTITFSGFPTTGPIPFNQPHFEILKNGVRVHEDQLFFNTAIYQADLVRVRVVKGDVLQVVTRWSADETRDRSSQAPTTIATFNAETCVR